MAKEEIEHKKRRYLIIILMALLVAFLAVVMAQNAQDTADINNVFAPFLNNTNLAPQFPGEPTGTGERVTGVTYWANDSPIWLMAFSHANTAAQTAGVTLFINGTMVEPSSGKPLGAAEEANKSVVGIIPKGANYSVVFDNYHHYEWREYPILSGKNGTLSLNSSVSDAQLNLKVNKTGDTMTGGLHIVNDSGMSFSVGDNASAPYMYVNMSSGAVLTIDINFTSALTSQGLRVVNNRTGHTIFDFRRASGSPTLTDDSGRMLLWDNGIITGQLIGNASTASGINKLNRSLNLDGDSAGVQLTKGGNTYCLNVTSTGTVQAISGVCT